MTVSRLIVLSLTTLLTLAGQVPAQPLRDAPTPAEFPPASYRGQQYVDSAGCVFIRAGSGDQVTWVPRVTRDRRALCGFQPSLARSAPAAPVASVAPRTTPAPPPAPKPLALDIPVPTRPAAPQPETPLHVSLVPGSPATPATVPRGTRVTRAHIYASQVVSTMGIHVPKGMKPAWNDDRLNPKRAHQTFEGKAQMEQIWTDTVPRRLKSAAPLRATVSTQGSASR